MKKFNRTAHMTLWLAIADRLRVTGVVPNSINEAKAEALKTIGFRETFFPISKCFACEYATKLYRDCGRCPLKVFDCRHYPFNDVNSACEECAGRADEDYVKAFYDACVAIAMWPVKKGVLCE